MRASNQLLDMLMTCKFRNCIILLELADICLCSGYHITLITDATAAFTHEQKNAATEIVWPLFASELLTVDAYVAELKKL
jgi:hypothetical protein